jgi:hypothetical protein
MPRRLVIKRRGLKGSTLEVPKRMHFLHIDDAGRSGADLAPRGSHSCQKYLGQEQPAGFCSHGMNRGCHGVSRLLDDLQTPVQHIGRSDPPSRATTRTHARKVVMLEWAARGGAAGQRGHALPGGGGPAPTTRGPTE